MCAFLDAYGMADGIGLARRDLNNDLRIDITWLLSLHLHKYHRRRCGNRYSNYSNPQMTLIIIPNHST